MEFYEKSGGFAMRKGQFAAGKEREPVLRLLVMLDCFVLRRKSSVYKAL